MTTASPKTTGARARAPRRTASSAKRAGAALADRQTDNRISGVVIARVAAASEGGCIRVLIPGCEEPIAASACSCDPATLVAGSPVAVMFDGGDLSRPIVLGAIVSGLDSATAVPSQPRQPPDELVLEAGSQLTLRCGKASLSLSADGNAALRGVNVTTRASHTNRIRGGNVQIN